MSTAKAVWEGVTIAESAKFEIVEGNVYFPPESINKAYVKESALTTVCPIKGTANYLSIEVDGKENKDACWYYATPKPAAHNITGHYAFWKGVTVTH
jgi:uncharacterized protein (DUF427 family)